MARLTFVRLCPSALYVPKDYLGDPRSALVGLFLDQPGPEQVHLTEVWGRCSVVIWHLEIDPGRFFPQLAEKLSDLRQGRGRLAYFDAQGDRSAVLETETDVTALSGAVDFPLNGESYELVTASRSTVDVQDDRLVFAAPPERSHRCVFSREGGGVVELALDGPLTLALNALTKEPRSPQRGTLSFRLPLDDQGLDQIGVHLRYSRVRSWIEESNGELTGEVSGSRFPIFRPGSTPITMAGVFDPLRPLDPERTRLDFELARRIPSDFETVLGYGVTLKPLEGASLFLDHAPLSVADDGSFLSKRSYWSPDGAFEMATNASGQVAEQHLVTGISTSEFVPFRPAIGPMAERSEDAGEPGDRLRFHAKRPAMGRRSLERSSFGRQQEPGTGADALLSELSTTSWISIESPATGRSGDRPLHTQPEEITLYSDSASDEGPRRLAFASQTRPSIEGRPFPAVPFLGLKRVGGNVEEPFKKEAELISAARQAELPEATAGVPAARSSAQRFTPQGFPVRLEGNRWKRVTFAKTKLGEFGIDDLGDAFTRVLVRDRVFLVASRLPDGLGTVLDDPEVGGWGLSIKKALNPGPSAAETGRSSDSSPPPTLIFKYHDRSLADLVDDFEAWNEPGTFNLQPRRLQEQLREYLNDTRLRHKNLEEQTPGSSPYGPFLRRIDDPNWNGILALHLDLIPKDLPLSIQGLFPGIDFDRFKAHSFGIEQSRLGQESADIEESSLFGVVDYPLPPSTVPRQPNDGIADLEVETLRLQFESSEVKRFDCRVRVWLNQVFDDNVQQIDGASGRRAQDNSITFDGRYESRLDPDGNKVETYTFVHEGDYRFKFGEGSILKELRISRLQLTTVESDGQKGRTRIGFWGYLSFNSPDESDLDLFGIERLDFTDLGIHIDFDLGTAPTFSLDLGALRFNLSNVNWGDGLLAHLPFDLKFFQVAPENLNLKLPDLGYFSFGGGDLFKYGLGFELDLGSLGTLAKKLEGFVLETIMGWLPEGGGFAFGFKLKGNGAGGLDLGIEGVLKLLVDQYKIEKVTFGTPPRKIYALQAVDCRLEVLGREFPDKPELQLFFFVDPEEAALQKRNAKIGWLAKLKTENSGATGGLEIPLLALGQRVNAYLKPGVPTARQIADHIQTKIGELNEAGDLTSLADSNDLKFDPSREWTVALRTVLWDLAELDLIFLDPDLYGVHLKVPPGQTNLFALDVLYRRITDDLGVYATELTLPDAWRQMEFGYFSLTLPVIGLDIYTNGDFQIDVGYPWDLDFSRSCSVQVLPFLGSGGLYYAQLSSASSSLVPSPKNKRFTYDPVIQSGFAARFGLGKEFRKGALRAGVSVTAFAMLEGAWGRRREITDATDTGHPTPPADYFYLAGTTGVLGEVYGYVDFGIVKAGVDVRVWVAFGWVLETWQPVVLSVEAGVRVRVRVVIGRVRILGKKIEIKITFRFSTRLRFEWTLGSGDPRWNETFERGSSALIASRARGRRALPPAALPAPRPLVFETVPELLDPPVELDLLLSPDVTLVDDQPEAALLLTLAGGPSGDTDDAQTPFAVLAKALLSWAVWACFPDRRGEGPVETWTLTAENLTDLENCLAEPSPGQRAVPSYGDLTAFFAANFRFNIRDPEEDESIDGAVFPFFPDLALTFTHDGTGSSHELWNFRLLSEDFGQVLDAHFERLRVLLEERAGGDVGRFAAQSRPVAELLFEDYFQLLLRSGADALADTLPDAGPTNLGQRFQDLGQDGGWGRLAAGVGRFFLYGLRVPDPSSSGDHHGLFAFAGQQRRFFEGGLPPVGSPDIYELGLKKNPDSPFAWLTADVTPIEVSVAGLRRLAEVSVPRDLIAVEARSPIRPRPRREALRRPTRWQRSGTSSMLWTLPEQISRRLRGGSEEELTLHQAKDGESLGNGDGPAFAVTWSTRVELRVSRISQGTGFVSGLYRLLPMADEGRRGVEAVLGSPLAPGASLNLLLPAEGGGSTSADAAAVSLWRTDLSTEPRPEGAALRATVPRVSAELSELRDFLELIRRASVARSDGYFLSYGPGLPDPLFASEAAELTLLVTYSGVQKVVSPIDSLATSGSEPEPSEIFYLRSKQNDFDVALPLGTVGFRAYRRDPEKTLRRPASLASSGLPADGLTREQILEAAGLSENDPGADALLIEAGSDEVEMATRFHLVDYATPAVGPLEPLRAEDALPVAPSEVEKADPTGEPRNRPAGVKKGDWCYEQTLPVFQWTSKPPAERSIYDGVGVDLPVSLGLRDLYGNQLPDSIRELTLPVRYFDRLLPMTEWPSTTVGFLYEPHADGKLALVFRFDPGGFIKKRGENGDPDVWLDRRIEDDRQRIDDARELYARAKQQLLDPQTKLAAEHLPEPGTERLLKARGTSDPGHPLITLIDQIETFLAGLENVPPTGPELPVGAERTFRVPALLPGDQNLVELGAHLDFSRPRNMAHPKVRDEELEAVWQIKWSVTPLLAGISDSAAPVDEEPVVLPAFSRPFQAAFPDFRPAVGAGETGARALWAVHQSLVQWEMTTDPVPSFALPPLSTDLLSGDVAVRDTGIPGYPEATVRTADLDLDVQARTFLREVEEFVSPAFWQGAQSRVPQASKPETFEVFEGVVRSKDRMAKSLSAEMISVFEGVAGGDALERCKSLLRDRLAADLRNGYDVDSAFAVPLSRRDVGRTGGIYAFGRLSTSNDSALLRPGNVILDGDTFELPVLVDALKETGQKSISFSDLSYGLTHIARKVGDELDGSPKVEWLQLVKPEKLDLGVVEVPVPVRRYPDTPVLSRHGQPETKLDLAGLSLTDTLDASRRWAYEVDFDHNPVAQDTVYLDITYNRSASSPASALVATESVFKALVGYGHHRETIWKELREASGDGLKKAIQAFGVLVGRVADAFAAGPSALRAAAELRERYQITDIDHDQAGKRKLEACRLEKAFKGGFEIEALLADGSPIPDQMPGAASEDNCVATIYAGPIEPERFYRRFRRLELDVNLAQLTWAGAEIQRNSSLDGASRSVRDEFIYRTPQVRFGEPFTPSLDVARSIPVPRSSGLAADITTLLQAVCGPALCQELPTVLDLRWGFESGLLARSLAADEPLRAPHPVALMPPFSLVKSGAGGDRFTAEQAARASSELLEGWLRSNPLPLGGQGAAFVLDLRLYSRLESSGRPVLRLRRLVVPVAS